MTMDPVIQITMDETMKEDTDDEGKERMEEEEEEEDYNTVSNTSSDGYDTDLEIPVKPSKLMQYSFGHTDVHRFFT